MRILLVESDMILLEQYSRKLARHHELTDVQTAQEAIDRLDSGISFDLIVMDFSLGSNNGVEMLHEIRSYDDWSRVPVIFLSTVPRNRLPLDRLEVYGVEEVLYKPQLSPAELLEHVQRVAKSTA